MNLLSIRLNNVRRFTSPVAITGIGPGLNLLCAPNESGKSTVFEALSAVFFKRANSWDKDMRAMVPHAGGDPEVEVEFEAGGKRMRLAKTWSSAAGRRAVRLWEGDRLLAQSDAAETMIADLVEAPKQGGPAGLLWVRQGVTALESDRTGREIRRGLLSSIAGEVEAMTGGRRMEQALKAVSEDLDRYLTPTGKPRTNGPLADAEQDVAALEARHTALTATLRDLREALVQRARLQGQLAALEDPEAQAEMRGKLAAAREAHTHAERHAERLFAATAAAEAARAAHGNAVDALARMDELIAERAAADRAIADAAGAIETATAAATEARRQRDDLARCHAAAVQDSRQAAAILSRVERAATARSAAALGTELQAKLARGERLSVEIARLKKTAGQGPDAAAMSRLEVLWDALRVESRTAEALAPRLLARYRRDAAGPITWAGGALEDGVPMPVPSGVTLELPGIGTLDVASGAAGAEDTVAEARRALESALAEADCDDIDAARAAAARRAESQRALEEVRRSFATDFPDGLDPIRARIAALPEPVPDDESLPSRDAAVAAATAARDALADAEGRLLAARDHAEQAGRAEQAAVTARDGAQDRRDRVSARMSAEGADAEGVRAQLESRCTVAATALDKVETTKAALEHDAPDLDLAKTRLTRLTTAQEGADQRRIDLRGEIARLDGHISTAAGAAPEEEANDAETRLAAAIARRDAIRFEVAVLTRLKEALNAARDTARDRYIAPIMAELSPLLAMLLPGSELALDADSLLPEALIRDGQKEGEEILSGGTREQIALLVRLAFARLLSRSGRPAPVLLDDAIVFTDDDRIERLFDALTRQAEDLQILVFSCRQKAFRDLGGRQLCLAPVTERLAERDASPVEAQVG